MENHALLLLAVLVLALLDRPAELEALHGLAVTRLQPLRVPELDHALRPLPLDALDLRARALDFLSVDVLESPVRVALADLLLANRMDVGLAEVEERDGVAVGEERREFVQLAAHVGVHRPRRGVRLAVRHALRGVRLGVKLVRADFGDDDGESVLVSELRAPSLDERLEELGVLAVAEVGAALVPDRALDRHRIERMDESRVHGRRAEHVDRARVVRLAALGVIPDVLRHLLADACLELHLVRLCARRPKRDRDRLEHAARPTFLACGIDLVAHRKDVLADASMFLDGDAVAVVGVARAAESMAVQIVHVLPVRLTVANGPVLLEVCFRKLECRAHPDLAGEALGERIALEAASVDRKLLPALVLDEIRVVERRLGVDEVGSGVEALVPLEDLLLVYLGSAGLHEVGPAVVPEAGNALRVARAVILRPGLVYPAVDFRGAPGGVHESDRDVERLVELPAHPVERRAVLAHRLVRRGLPVDADRVLARERRVPVVAVVHEECADVGVALRLLEELLAADREASVARERVGHVGLAAAEPDVAKEDVRD